jgi:hypothetical protein
MWNWQVHTSQPATERPSSPLSHGRSPTCNGHRLALGVGRGDHSPTSLPAYPPHPCLQPNKRQDPTHSVFWKEPTAHAPGCGPQMASVKNTDCHGSTEVPADRTNTNRQSCVPIKLYVWTQNVNFMSFSLVMKYPSSLSFWIGNGGTGLWFARWKGLETGFAASVCT